MTEPEIEHWRKSLDELRQRIYDRDHENARELGHAQGWRERVEAQLERIEDRLDTLLFLQADRSPRKARAGRRPAAPAAVSATAAVPPPAP